jgi:phenylalanyl-tRNA synthetase beta chain
MTHLRRSLIPSLIDVVEGNARRGIESYRFFEIDRVFASEASGQNPREDWVVAGLIGGPLNSAAWLASEKQVGFLHVKGLVQNLLARVGMHDVGFDIPANTTGFIQNETILVTINGKVAGTLGLLDMRSRVSKTRTRVPLYGFELNLSKFQSVDLPARRFKEIARTPSVTRDISIAVPADVPYSHISQSLTEAFAVAANSLVAEPRGKVTPQLRPVLESVVFVDLYTGSDLGAQVKSLTLRMTFRDEQHTLTSGEAQQLVESVVSRLQAEHQARQR